ncbi:MAG: HIT family protein [Oxalobacteraceae bacterium]|nr:HIT family protein [Oxalobacteraceae bacterium]
MSASTCELCETAGGEVLHQAAQFRVVLVDDDNYPGFCRVIWCDHVKEVTDLPELDRMLLMDVLWQVEHVLREVMQPEKINLASFGNVVPHLHWHVIPRYTDDVHFPQPVWGQAQRAPQPASLQMRRERLGALRAKMRERLVTYV